MLQSSDPRRVAQKDLQGIAREAQYLNRLPQPQLLRMIKAGTAKQFPGDTLLLREGSEVEEVYFILRGNGRCWFVPGFKSSVVAICQRSGHRCGHVCSAGPTRIPCKHTGPVRRGCAGRPTFGVCGSYRGRADCRISDPPQPLQQDVDHQPGDAEGNRGGVPRAFPQLATTLGRVHEKPVGPTRVR